ncbi:MAG TPA: CehA/McbA family metallohydrolase [Bryobacteraceae bacterium]|nr:CehA/McbA family metallohydrolase [Bryobacteraceae bacterium]
MRFSTAQLRGAAILTACILLAGAFLRTQKVAAGQAAVSLSRPGQDDISFWVNHNGLLQFDAEGEVGFGDIARILLRRRANGEYLRELRDRFTFRVQNSTALLSPDIFRAEFTNGKLTWRSAPQNRFVAGSSRTFNIPVIVTNHDAKELSLQVLYKNDSMESAVRNVVIAPGASSALVLRAVETTLGPSAGKLTLQYAGAELATNVYFDIRPLVPLRVRLVNERGGPVTARVYLTGSDGLSYAPRGSSSRISAMSAEYYFHAEDTFEIEMPAGDTLIEAARGQEYRLSSMRKVLEPGKPAEATLRLERWANMAEKGFWSADVHIHANYTAPHHQVIEPRDVRLQVTGEDLNVANMMVANSGGAFIHDRQYFEGRPHRLSSPENTIYWNEENRSSAYGHMCFLGLTKLVEPFYNGFRNTPYWDDYPANYPLAQQVFDQGGAVSYAHPGMAANFEGASIKEMPVDLALGHKTAMDVLSNNDENATMELWYRLLNCGFQIPISAGTDAFTNVADHYIAGGGRVYVQSGQAFDYRTWIKAFREGRSFASNGPVVSLKVDGKAPGDEIRLNSAGEITVEARVDTQVPLDKVDVMVNGRSVYSVSAAGKDSITFTQRLPVSGSCWVALRALGPRHRLILNDTMAFAHTSPVYVNVGGRPVRVPDDVRFYREWVERLIARTESSGRFASPDRKVEVLALFRKALGFYQGAERQ